MIKGQATDHMKGLTYRNGLTAPVQFKSEKHMRTGGQCKVVEFALVFSYACVCAVCADQVGQANSTDVCRNVNSRFLIGSIRLQRYYVGVIPPETTDKCDLAGSDGKHTASTYYVGGHASRNDG